MQTEPARRKSLCRAGRIAQRKAIAQSMSSGVSKHNSPCALGADRLASPVSRAAPWRHDDPTLTRVPCRDARQGQRREPSKW